MLPVETLDSDLVRKRTLLSVAALSARQLVVHGVTFAASLLLAWWLGPAMFGIFAIAASVMIFLTMSSDLGLAAALVRIPEPPREQDLRAFFTLQLLVYSVVTLGMFVLAPSIALLYRLPADSTWPIRGLALALWMSAFRSVPALLLERRLEFGRIALVDTLATIGYYAALLLCVKTRWELWSLPIASGAKALLDVASLSYYEPWRPRLTAQLHRVIPFLRFGLALQGIRLLAFAKDNLAIVLAAPVLGPSTAGYLHWALLYAGIPLYFTSLVTRVSFPAFARLQHDPGALGELVTTSLRFTLAVGVPASLALTLWAPQIVPILYGDTWLPALPAVDVLIVNMMAGLILGVLFTLMYSVSSLRQSSHLLLWWVTLTYGGVAFVLVTGWGLLGIVWSYSIATMLITIPTVRTVRPRVPFSLSAAARPSLLAGLPVAALGTLVRLNQLPAWPALVLALSLYSAIFLLHERASVRTWVHRFRMRRSHVP